MPMRKYLYLLLALAAILIATGMILMIDEHVLGALNDYPVRGVGEP